MLVYIETCNNTFKYFNLNTENPNGNARKIISYSSIETTMHIIHMIKISTNIVLFFILFYLGGLFILRQNVNNMIFEKFCNCHF